MDTGVGRTVIGILCSIGIAGVAFARQPSELRYKAEAATAAKPALVARYGPDDLGSGQLRLPAGKGPFPVAVVIHGGC